MLLNLPEQVHLVSLIPKMSKLYLLISRYLGKFSGIEHCPDIPETYPLLGFGV